MYLCILEDRVGDILGMYRDLDHETLARSTRRSIRRYLRIPKRPGNLTRQTDRGGHRWTARIVHPWHLGVTHNCIESSSYKLGPTRCKLEHQVRGSHQVADVSGMLRDEMLCRLNPFGLGVFQRVN